MAIRLSNLCWAIEILMAYKNIFRWLMVLPFGIIGWVAGDFLATLLINASIFLGIKTVWPLSYLQDPEVAAYHFVLFGSYFTAVLAASLVAPKRNLLAGTLFACLLFTYRSFMTFQRLRGSEFTPDSPMQYAVGSVFAFCGLIVGIWILYIWGCKKTRQIPSLPGTKRLARKMIQGVDIIKLILYKVLTNDYSTSFEDIEYCKNLAAVSVNEIFDNHAEETLQTFNENKEVVINGIINLGKQHPDLKRIITDALRVFVQANWMLTGTSKNFQDLKVFKNAMERGIFIKGGEHPEPVSFLEMVEDLEKKYDLH